jgi:DNA-binding transcriptional LysR family regulator
VAFDGRILSGVSVLAAVVEAGSFGRAAEALGLTQSSVSRAIVRLEARVGVRLLDRTTRSVRLTSEGQRLYGEIGHLLAGIGDAVTMASGSATAVRGRLRVNVDPFFSSLLLAPRLEEFLERWPEVALELIVRRELGDLVADGFDLAIRFGEQPSSSLVARRLLRTRILTVASRAYLERHGRPARPADLTVHNCIQFRDPVSGQPFPWEFHRGRKVVAVKTTGRLLLTDVGTMLGACLAGAGIAQVMELGVQDLLREGRLIDLFPDWPDETFPLYVLYPSRQLPPARLRAFLEFLLELTKAHAI